MPNTIEENIERLKATVPAIKNSIITKGGTVNSGDGLEEFADDVLSIKNELIDISITSNGEYYSGEETTLTTTTFPVTVLDAVGTPLKHVDVIGNANQSGTPTPDNPIMPQGCGERTGNLFSGDFSQFDNVGGTGDIYTYFYIPEDFTLTLVAKDTHTIPDNIFLGITKNGGQSTGGFTWVIPQRKNITEGDVFTVKSSTSGYHYVSMYRKITSVFNWILEHYYVMLNLGSTALPYEPYGIKIPISNGGENLWDNSSTITKGQSPSYYTANFGTPLPTGTYTFSAKVVGEEGVTACRLSFRKSNMGQIVASNIEVSPERTSITVTLNEPCYAVYMYGSNDTTTLAAVTYQDIMLNTGSTALPYEPYRHITTSTYLGEVETVRYVKKLVLDGTEDFQSISSGNNKYFRLSVEDFGEIHIDTTYCTHFESVSITSSTTNVGIGVIHSSVLNKDALGIRPPQVSTTSLEDFTTYLTQQYNNGTPVTVWYVLATPTTGIVNEPLMRIGEYADELSIDTNIPLTQNTKNIINIDTTLKPSSASFTYNKKGNYIGYNKINVNVSNTYTAEDEGKVVNNAALVSQTAMPAEITVNDTYDTTLYNSIVVNVPSAPTPTPSTKSDVTFYDYDGTIVQSYSANDFANLSELPANPTHEGLTAQGWNWSLADAKTYVANYGSLNIGQMYTTSDGKTRLYISLSEGRTSPILQLYLNDNSELDIDWGDGSTHSTFTATSSEYKSERHEYSASGDYVIAITVVSGGFELQSSSTTTVSSILWNGNNKVNSPDKAYNNAIKKIEIGDNVTSIGVKAFYGCSSLSSIAIPDSVTTISDSAFSACYSLLFITIPDNVTSISSGVFAACSSLSSIAIPDSVTSISSGVFGYCSSLSLITIPDSITSISSSVFSDCSSLSSITIPPDVTSIADYAFYSCYSLSSITIPPDVTSIGSSAFYNCAYMSYIKFESTTPPTVTNSNAWRSLSTSTKILVPTGTLEAYKSATNYPNPSTYTYEEY